jgi:hypothetical protein
MNLTWRDKLSAINKGNIHAGGLDADTQDHGGLRRQEPFMSGG